MENKDSLSPAGLDALRARFEQQSRRAQAYYTVMHLVRDAVGSDEAASDWMNQPSPALGGLTPGQLVEQGREEEALRHAAALKRPAPG
ncbi:Protein of unknown function [Noviherbaspirillum humi]|uniref:Antitoxin Xre/MbcA/ParS-like toxin-binding domain-containing protein n=1 Tax=Noviherbaspirillum humi TaxID=1688639 RepID=A0A239M0A8_9BURK|nr:MbcA/ParS/Xre antitoxin family protein [Noviherbaspirillum humi]SNT35568.1 Protein of unknown function [Noviherbaspirillum humi]